MEMETETLLPKPTYGGIKRHWRRRRYQRLDDEGATTSGKKKRIVRLRRSPRMYWRIRFRALRWLRRVAMSPLNLLAKFPNAYTNFMWRFAGNVGAINTDSIFGGKRAPKGRHLSKGYSGDAFEARLIYEISKNLVASHELNPM